MFRNVLDHLQVRFGERGDIVRRTLGPVEYVVLIVTVVAAGTVFLRRALRA